MKTLLHKLNWRLIILHVVASWSFLWSFHEFILIHDYDFIYVFHPNRTGPVDQDRVMMDFYWSAFSNLTGLLSAFLISLSLSLKEKWFWLNSLLVFLISLLTTHFVIQANLGYYISFLFSIAPGFLWKFAGIGTIFLAFGMLLFFSKYTMQFINSSFTDSPKTEKPHPGDKALI